MRIGILAFFAIVACCATSAEAAMGLKCSQWLDARAYIRYDARTNQFRDERPRTVAPVSTEIEEKVSWATWYISGHVAARFLLDKYLAKTGDAVGVSVSPANPKDETLREMTGLDNLCRAGLQKEGRDYDIADLIDLHANAVLGQRASDVTAMLEHATEAGRRLGSRSQ
jgi:hypothetical protein